VTPGGERTTGVGRVVQVRKYNKLIFRLGNGKFRGEKDLQGVYPQLT